MNSFSEQYNTTIGTYGYLKKHLSDIFISDNVQISNISLNNLEAEILLSLIYAPLTPFEIADSIGRSIPDVTAALRSLVSQGYLESNSGRYSLVVPKKQAAKVQ